jgi:hypothetical protein
LRFLFLRHQPRLIIISLILCISPTSISSCFLNLWSNFLDVWYHTCSIVSNIASCIITTRFLIIQLRFLFCISPFIDCCGFSAWIVGRCGWIPYIRIFPFKLLLFWFLHIDLMVNILASEWVSVVLLWWRVVLVVIEILTFILLKNMMLEWSESSESINLRLIVLLRGLNFYILIWSYNMHRNMIIMNLLLCRD